MSLAVTNPIASNSISSCLQLNAHANSRPCRIAYNSATTFVPNPVLHEKPILHVPYESRIHPPAPAFTGLPMELPSVLSFHQPAFRGIQEMNFLAWVTVDKE